MSEVIFTVLVGSMAHGLATPQSDVDKRGVFIVPTSRFLEIGGEKVKATSWVEGAEDNTSYEVGHFLELAIHSNPSILEIFKAEECDPTTGEGRSLKGLFDHVWSAKGVYDAFTGYSHNQQVKFLSDKEEFSKRRWKYAVAYIRTLLNAEDLLTTGTFSLVVNDTWRPVLRAVRNGTFTTGQVMDMAGGIAERVKRRYEAHPSKETNLDAVNTWLLATRKSHWQEGVCLNPLG